MISNLNTKIFQNTEYANTQMNFSEAKSENKGTILLVHGTAPQNIDGSVPIPKLQEKISLTNPDHYLIKPFYKDLSNYLNSFGWNTVRYTRIGVYHDSVRNEEYCKTDLNNIMVQLKTIFNAIPNDKPRIVFSWSGGSIHALQLPLNDLDGLVIFGGIATKRTDLHNYSRISKKQKNDIQKQLDEILSARAEVLRTDMLNLDMPFGRFYDENDLNDNWTYLKPFNKLPTLILHGKNDNEVNVRQAEFWKVKLSNHNITEIFKDNANHAWGCSGNQDDSEDLASVINAWLTRKFVQSPGL